MDEEEVYGITNTGFNKKRLNVILAEIQSDINNAFGFDISAQPYSLINVLTTVFANRIAQLWELSEQAYHSQFPAYADGIQLDNVCAKGGMLRKKDRASQIKLRVLGKQGASVTAGATATVTINQKEYVFSCITTTSINIPVPLYENQNPLTDEVFDYTPGEGDESLDGYLYYNDVIFQANEPGDVFNSTYVAVQIPFFLNATDCYPIALLTDIIDPGQFAETDSELRERYLMKTMNLSASNTDKIASSLYTVDGVSYAEVNEVEGEGIMIFAIGGDDGEIAKMVMKNKTPGVPTVKNPGTSSVTITVDNVYGSSVDITINRPTPVYVYFTVEFAGGAGESEETLQSWKNTVQETLASYYATLPMGTEASGIDLDANDVVYLLKQAISGTGAITVGISETEGDQDPAAYIHLDQYEYGLPILDKFTVNGQEV